jgi:hypothetical protein
MDIQVQTILFDALTIEQIGHLTNTLEDLAKHKHEEITRFYLSKADKQEFAQDIEETVARSCWEDFLPFEYQTLMKLRDEKGKENKQRVG